MIAYPPPRRTRGRLEHKVAIVTGGSRGIGRAIALRLAGEGAAVAFSYNSSPDKADEVLEDLEAIGAPAFCMKCDVSQSGEVAEFVQETLRTFGTIDILVNNAGVTRDKLIMRMSEEDWDTVIDTNLKSSFLFCREVAKTMIQNHSGKIIFVSSIVATFGNPGQSNYVASKAGMIGLTKALAGELASRNIQVNCIAPGFVETDMTLLLSDEQKAAIMTSGLKRRFAKPEKIAGFAAFLASSDSDLVTGQVFSVEATQLRKEERAHFTSHRRT